MSYLSADLILSPLLMILYLNLSATGNKVFVKCTQGPTFSVFLWWFICSDWSATSLFFFYFFRKKTKKTKPHWRNPACRHSMRSEWFYLMHCELSGPPSGQFSLAWLGRRGKSLCAGWRAWACACVCVSGGETLFLDVTAQPSLPLLSNTSLLFRGFHRRPAIHKTRSPASPADLLERGAGCEGLTHMWEVNVNKSR